MTDIRGGLIDALNNKSLCGRLRLATPDSSLNFCQFVFRDFTYCNKFLFFIFLDIIPAVNRRIADKTNGVPRNNHALKLVSIT